jgi:NAD(P)-dependent dehydrogenase (short-subunit alcohol dehydrogenase family)
MTFAIDLSSHTALITGGGQGVGFGIAQAMVAAGAHVLVNDLVADRAEAAAAGLAAEGGSAEALAFDVSDYDAVTAAVGGRHIDILVNNAGNAGPQGYDIKPFVETTPADWDRYFAVNMYGAMHCTRAVLPGMIERNHGRLITIVSEAGRSGEPSLAAYSAAKAAAAGFMRSIAKDVGRYTITANNIALATVDTFGMVERAKEDPAMAEQIAKHVKPYLIRRLGVAEDVAAMATFLASPLAGWITGQTYPVNGGYVINQ